MSGMVASASCDFSQTSLTGPQVMSGWIRGHKLLTTVSVLMSSGWFRQPHRRASSADSHDPHPLAPVLDNFTVIWDCARDPHPWPCAAETKVIETRNKYDGQTVGDIYRDPNGAVVRQVIFMYNQEKVAMEREDTGWLCDQFRPSLYAAKPTHAAHDAGDGEQRQLAPPELAAKSPVIRRWPPTSAQGNPAAHRLMSVPASLLDSDDSLEIRIPKPQSARDPHPWPPPESRVIETRNQYDGQTVAEIYRDPSGTVVVVGAPGAAARGCTADDGTGGGRSW